MSDGASPPAHLGARLRPRGARRAGSWLRWSSSIALPWLFYDWAHHRHSGFVVSMLSQMGMMVIFALWYNMLMGQAGLLSFGHAVFFGLGGYCTIHVLNARQGRHLPVPIELMPLVGGLAGLGFAIVFGYMATKQRATAFAMITLGIGELVTAAAMMFQHLLRRRGRRQHQPHDRPQPVRPVLRVRASRSTT